MSEALGRLLHILDLERVDDHAYQGVSFDPGAPHLFGGQVLAQALAAVHREADTPSHSLHAYFLQRGTASEPVRFDVQELRRSRAFVTYRVAATQGESEILDMTVSHHVSEEGLCHQIDAEAMGEPEGVPYERALLQVMTPQGSGDDTTPFELPVEILSVGGMAFFSEEVREPRARCWMRVRASVGDDPRLHQCLFAYASDYAIMIPCIHPHSVSIMAVQSASLDHAIWFHRPFRMDEWMLFELTSPVADGARGMGQGTLYARDGRLVASCTQEALIRPGVERR